MEYLSDCLSLHTLSLYTWEWEMHEEIINTNTQKCYFYNYKTGNVWQNAMMAFLMIVFGVTKNVKTDDIFFWLLIQMITAAERVTALVSG